MINFSVTEDEANAILNVLGQLPTSSGAWPLLMKLKEQAEEQIKPAEDPAPVAAPKKR